MKESEDELSNIKRKLSSLEQHVINLILPIQELRNLLGTGEYLSNLQCLLNQPIQVDDRALRIYLDKFLTTNKEQLKLLQEHNFSHTLGEIKYMNARLKSIEEKLATIEKDGIKREISLSVKTDNVRYEPEVQEIVTEEDKWNIVLQGFKERYQQAIRLYYKESTVPRGTQKKIATRFGVTPGTVKTYLVKVIRVLAFQYPERIKYIPSAGLKEDVIEYAWRGAGSKESYEKFKEQYE